MVRLYASHHSGFVVMSLTLHQHHMSGPPMLILSSAVRLNCNEQRTQVQYETPRVLLQKAASA